MDPVLFNKRPAHPQNVLCGFVFIVREPPDSIDFQILPAVASSAGEDG
jgi:hypothetical protein